MGGFSLKAWTVSLGLLAGTWSVVVLTLASVIPAPDAQENRFTGVAPVQQRASSTYPLRVAKKLPCTNEDVTLDLLLALDTKWHTDGEWVDFVVQARLTSSPSENAPGEIEPAAAYFGFSSPNYGRAGHVHELHARLLGQPAGAELVVGIEQATDGEGQLIVQPGQMRLVCA
jgi:hypothetical protein